MKSLLNRRSVRAYKPEPLPREALEQIVAAGKLAPSAMNKQPYHITVVTNSEKLEVLSGFAQKEMLANPNLPSHIREKITAPDFNGIYHAPCMILVSADENGGTWAVSDSALVCENMMIAARELEIGSCWLGAYTHIRNLEGVSETLHVEFGIPEGYVLTAGIVFGYPADGFPEPRARRDDNVNWVE